MQEEFRTDKRDFCALQKKRIDRLLAMSKEYNKVQMYLGMLAILAQYRLSLFCFLFYLTYSPFFRFPFLQTKSCTSYDPILPTYLPTSTSDTL